jgi:hypothetical protein
MGGNGQKLLPMALGNFKTLISSQHHYKKYACSFSLIVYFKFTFNFLLLLFLYLLLSIAIYRGSFPLLLSHFYGKSKKKGTLTQQRATH